MKTPILMSPNMVAAGPKGPGNAAQSANSQAVEVVKVPAMPAWAPRSGRGPAYVMWKDALRYVLPRLGLRLPNIYEEPPARPMDNALSVESLAL